MVDYEREREVQRNFGKKKLTRETDTAVPKNTSKTGHEAALARAVKERRSMCLEFPDKSTVVGELIAFDKYTICLRLPNGVSKWYFKSSVICFEVLKPSA